MMMDPCAFVDMCWPDMTLSRYQKEIMYSVRDNDETYVPAGNGLGKDFIAGLVALWFFLAARPSRVLTTSVKLDQLDRVLWGEIRRFINTSKVNLPIQVNYMLIRQLTKDGQFVDLTELQGQVVTQGEALLGRHVPRGPDNEPRTLAIFDEASGIPDSAYISSNTWAHRKFIIGNCFRCHNFFRRGVKGGDLKSPDPSRLYRKVIRVRAVDSPNVKLALEEIKLGKTPSLQIIIPGMIDYPTYVKHRSLMDKENQCVSLDGDFYEGEEVLLYPPDWMNLSEVFAESMFGLRRRCLGIGIDSAEGGDNTALVAVDEFGVIDCEVHKTPDTTEVVRLAVEFIKKHNCPHDRVLFDRGGGGKEHADRLIKMNYKVRMVAFSEGATKEPSRGMITLKEQKETMAVRVLFKNKRAEMYWLLRERLNPKGLHSKFSIGSGAEVAAESSFGISPKYVELHRQMRLMPLLRDGEDRMYMPSKRRKRKPDGSEQEEVTLTDILGCSPDEADALVLANYAMSGKAKRKIGAF